MGGETRRGGEKMKMLITRYRKWASKHTDLACIIHTFIGLGFGFILAPYIEKSFVLILGIIFLTIGIIGHTIPLIARE